MLCSCSKPETSASAHLGEPVDTLVKMEGEPAHTEKHPLYPVAKLLSYSQERIYQVENNKVVAFHRNPTVGEESIQKWFHLPGAERREVESAVTSSDHSSHQALNVARFLDLRKTVLYDTATGKVLKVIEK